MKLRKKTLSLILTTIVIGSSMFIGCSKKHDNTANVKSPNLSLKKENNAKEEGVKNPEEEKSVGDFKGKDLSGKEVDKSLFKENKLTMVNIWGTFCKPCIKEMPDIEKLYQEMKDSDVNIIGIVKDGVGKEDLAKEIVEKKEVTFTNIIPSKEMSKGFLKNINLLPTTIFIDSEGTIIGDTVFGSRSDEGYKKVIEKTLEEMKIQEDK